VALARGFGVVAYVTAGGKEAAATQEARRRLADVIAALGAVREGVAHRYDRDLILCSVPRL
jgi:hypothetical protein